MSKRVPNLQSVFAAALELISPTERARYLAEACGDDQKLRAEVESLLAAHTDAGSFLVSPESCRASVLTSLVDSIGDVPRVVLRDTDPGEDPSPVVMPASAEMPAHADHAARYQLFGEIAHGGMGAVLRGRDTDLGRDLAVKVLLEAHKNKPDLIRRFVEEAQIGGQLQHPGVVPIYDIGAFADHRPFFTMKLVKGQTLAYLLEGRKSSADGLPRFLSIFEQVCQTMAYAHARGDPP